MNRIIAVAGKGGVGKTTLAALMVLRLIAQGHRPILAVDADPNACLDGALGVKAVKTVGGVREDARAFAQEGMVQGMDKHRFLQLRIAESLVEDQDFDLIAMGRCEGPGCYCYANNVLKAVLQEMVLQYPYVVLDNEAGLENLSRRIVQKVDLLVLVTDPSVRGFDTVKRIHGLAGEMEVTYDKLAIIVNRLRRQELPASADELKAATGADLIIGLPDDDVIHDMAEAHGNMRRLPPNHPLFNPLDGILELVK
ncbi:MAG: Septum site-determining protein MinD [Syntrophus sp. SKADARSKE-3]|nr:Septum site-determining protein MinD [Syntrophus sp. SKADARSKE-3]